MGKTKTQAQKRLERQARIEEAKEKQQQEKLSRAQAYQNQQTHEVHRQTEPAILSKKALRTQKRKEGEHQDAIEKNSDSSLELAVDSRSLYLNVEYGLKKIMDVTEKEMQIFTTEFASARTVQNHSTYCPGFKPVLARLARDLPLCTMIPGELSQNKNSNYPHLVVYFQRSIDENNYKFVVRNGHTVQDLIISVTDAKIYSQVFLEECIEKAIQKSVKKEGSEEENDITEVSISHYNRLVAENREGFWRKEHQRRHVELKEQENIIKREKKVNKQSRLLANKSIPAAERKQYAERDVDIISGKTRGKNSMT